MPRLQNAPMRVLKALRQLTLGNRRSLIAAHPPLSCNVWQALRTSHACTASTLRQAGARFKRKLAFGCAEAVEEWNCLWKGMEKRGGNLWFGTALLT